MSHKALLSWRELKEKINKMSDEQLDSQVFILNDLSRSWELCVSVQEMSESLAKKVQEREGFPAIRSNPYLLHE